MKRLSLLLAVAIITVGSITAQQNIFGYRRHELSVFAGGGLSTLQYDPATGARKNGVGFMAGGGYTYFFTPAAGFGTGLEIAMYQANASLKDFTDSYDVSGGATVDNYTYSYALKNYSETQRVFALSVPLMLHFESGMRNKFFVRLGGKVGIPFITTGIAKKYEVATKGYFPHEGRTYDDLPQFGFGTYEYSRKRTSIDNFKLSYMASLETGLKRAVDRNNDLYIGLYVDYGLNNIQNKNDKNFVRGTLSEDKPKMSSIIESQYKNAPFTDKITPLAVGLKLRFTFLR